MITPTATVEISTIDRQGRPEPVYHGALRSLDDAFRTVSRFAPAPVGPSVRRRIETDGMGSFSIGQFDVSIMVLDRPSVCPATF